MAGDSAEKIRVVVVLAPQELLVFVELEGDVDLVTGGAELGGLVKRLEKSFLVKARLPFYQAVVDPLEKRVCAGSERIMKWLLDGVVGVSPRAVQVRDRVAHSARDAGMRRGVI